MGSLRRQAAAARGRSRARQFVRLLGRTYTDEAMRGPVHQTITESAMAADRVVQWERLDWPMPTAIELRWAEDDLDLAREMLSLLEDYDGSA